MQHAELKDLASVIVRHQTREMAHMPDWLRGWYGIDVRDPSDTMAAMHAGRMPTGRMGQGGMMAGQGMPMGGMHHMNMMTDLAKLPPARLEAAFISLMIVHHEGAIDRRHRISAWSCRS